MMSISRRKVCVVVASRANYGRVKSVMRAIQQHPQLELQLIVGASTLLERFGKAVNVIREDGFQPDRTIYYVVEGETLSTQSKSTGLGIVELTTAMEDLQPDMALTVADRFETMATAVASTYLNIPLIHLQGGEVSGNIDDRVRHAITKLADFHFTCSEISAERVVRMGEAQDRVFNFGCPAMDILADKELSINSQMMSRYKGVGKQIDWQQPYILMVQHPVTTSYGQGYQQVAATLAALQRFEHIQKVVLWPNIDAGSDEVSKGIRVFRENNMSANFAYYKNFSPEDYGRVLNNAACCVGNSSSFIREGAFLGVPVVMVGDRQRNRECGRNVVFAEYDEDNIYQQLAVQLNKQDIAPDMLFGRGDAGQKIADQLVLLDLQQVKQNDY